MILGFPLKIFWRFMFTEYGPEIKWGRVASSCTCRQMKYNYILYLLKSPSNEAMNNSALWSTTSSIANGLWLQVMKLVRGPVLIFPHFLSSQCKWRGINLKYWFAGLSEVLIVPLVTARAHIHPSHCAPVFCSYLPVRKSCLCSFFSLQGRCAQNKMRKRFSYCHPWIWYQGDS